MQGGRKGYEGILRIYHLSVLSRNAMNSNESIWVELINRLWKSSTWGTLALLRLNKKIHTLLTSYSLLCHCFYLYFLLYSLSKCSFLYVMTKIHFIAFIDGHFRVRSLLVLVLLSHPEHLNIIIFTPITICWLSYSFPKMPRSILGLIYRRMKWAMR